MSDDPRDAASLNGVCILLAVSGGIAAYKSVHLVREYMKRGAEVHVMMTSAARNFVHPTTFAAITGHPVGMSLFSDSGTPDVDHLSLPHTADLLVVAPATADLLARMAHGLADDLVSTALLAARCPVLVAPAMNSSMWEHPATQHNLSLLRDRGVHFVGPEEGEMAAPDEEPGVGRMSEPEVILEVSLKLLSESLDDNGPQTPPFLTGKRVLITAGRTEEAIDSVRFITNRSSGRTGCELARAARDLGAEVVLIQGPMEAEPPLGITVIPVRTALEMKAVVTEQAPAADVAIFAAAVADWRPEQSITGKLKRSEMPEGPPVLRMVENPDIAAETAPLVKGVAVGFALEEEWDWTGAEAKRARKGLDAILLNRFVGMGASTNELAFIREGAEPERSGEQLKTRLARWVFEKLQPLL